MFRLETAVWCIAFLSMLARADEGGPPVLAIGASASAFCLQGTDGEAHCLKEYLGSKILVVAFICNHCPTSQSYENRIKQLADDYRNRGI